MRVFGIDPGSERTGYGCVETDGRRHHLVTCGAIGAPAASDLPQRLAHIHAELTALLISSQPDCVAIENIFYANNARSALRLGHARGVAMLAAVQAGCVVVEYTPAEIKRAVVGYGRAEKHQVQQMIKLLLGLDIAPSPHDAADALAVAICHVHSMPPAGLKGKAEALPHVKFQSERIDEQQPAGLKGKAKALPHVKFQSDVAADLQVRADPQVRPDPLRPDLHVRPVRARSWRQYRPPQG